MRRLRALDLLQPAAPGQPPYLSAASGLVRSGSQLYVVADDELHLGRFPIGGNAPGHLIRLFAGDLPERPKARKRHKADLEILLRLPPLPGYPHGALLALGSGSRPRRQRGALLALDEQGEVSGAVLQVDTTALCRRLEREFGTVNLEGAWVHGTRLRLLQRGNQDLSTSALVDLDFATLAEGLVQDGVLADVIPRRVLRMNLGDIDGVRLSFTDACVLKDGSWLFSAVAEDTDDAYADGRLAGASLGLATPDAEIVWQRPLPAEYKVEGIHAEMNEGRLRVLCVTDADDRLQPAQLLEVGTGQ
ncbi:MAG: hypothetical protein ABW278_16005 [Steroidobacteraceae bacterium]